MLSNFNDLYRGVMLRCPSASVFLARSWVEFAFRTLWDKRLWSWQRQTAQFLFPALVNTGTVAVTFGSTTVTGTATGWTTDLVNRQFRIGATSPIYTIDSVDTVGQTLTLQQPWGGTTVSGIGYQIYQAYVTPATDFQSFISVIDVNFNWSLLLNVTQEQLNQWDAQRSNSGNAYVIASYDYDSFTTPPLPRFESWPHIKQQYVLIYLYTSRPPDLSDPGASLPRYIRGDVLLEMALAQAARWPGPSKDAPNIYFNLALAQAHDARATRMIYDMEVTDDAIYEQDAWYTNLASMPMATIPLGDSRFIQSHDL